MAVYAVGDIHGCYDAFRRLLSLIGFNKRHDRLWLVGDMVNRGPDSAGVLRWLRQHDDCITAVLGNHDLHMLAVRENPALMKKKDGFADVFNAADAGSLCEWLRRLPLAHYENGCLLVHAGVLPVWDAEATVCHAKAAAEVIGGDAWTDFSGKMYGDTPIQWHDTLGGVERLRVIINALTRMRICTPQGEMLMRFNGAVADIPDGYVPWFDVADRQTAGVKIICGHWAALGVVKRHNLLALDSGCFWGGALSAVRLDDDKLFQAAS